MPKFIFESLDEVAEFYDEYLANEGDAGTAGAAAPTTGRRRRGPNKAKTADAGAGQVGTGGAATTQTPAFQPPPTGPTPSAQPQAGFPGAAPTVQGFPGATTGQPTAHPLVAQIAAKVDAQLQTGAPMDPIVAWFRTALPGSEQANWEQMKASFLPQAQLATLMQIATQLGIPTQ